jgi:ribosomal protein S18 acetylase RimI-like enzyme
MIRLARPEEAAAIAYVHVRSWQQAYRELMPADYLASLDDSLDRREAWWRETIVQGTQTVFVALSGEQVAGWISVGASRDEDVDQAATGEVSAIYVLADHWGSGVGRALWLQGEKQLAGQGFTALTLWVLVDNHRATDFYRKAGLQPQAASIRSLSRGGQTLEEIRYRKTL